MLDVQDLAALMDCIAFQELPEPGVSVEAKALLMQLLQRDPEQRPLAEEVCLELRAREWRPFEPPKAQGTCPGSRMERATVDGPCDLGGL